jgi:hypothetical protein
VSFGLIHSEFVIVKYTVLILPSPNENLDSAQF